MTTKIDRSPAVWALVRRQHGVVTRRQLLALGFTDAAIRHRLETGRLHALRPGVYAVGRPDVTRLGELIAATLACGPDAVLSHASAGELWRLHSRREGPIELSVPARRRGQGRELVVHRRTAWPATTTRRGIPTVTPLWALVDLATQLDREPLEAAVNAADRLDLLDPEALRRGLDGLRRAPGVSTLRALLDRHTFVLTDSALERRFLPIVRRAGLPRPETRERFGRYRVDFLWPSLGLVVETDGLRYHRTPAQQAVDRRRDQLHAVAGRTQLRFSHGQIRYEPGHVEAVIAAVAARLLADRR